MLNNEKNTVSPVQTENEQINKTLFVANFKKLYLKMPIDEILNDFANCYLELGNLEDKLNYFLRKEVSNG